MKRWARHLPLLAVAALAVGLVASGAVRDLNLAALKAHDAQLHAWASARPALSLAAFVALYVAVVVACVPGILVMTLTGGFLFGTWVGGAAAVAGATLGSLGGYLAIRASLGGILRARAERSGGLLKRVMDGVARGAFGYLLALRLTPIAPFWLVNAAAALTDTPMRTYLLATLLGVMPGAFIYSAIGGDVERVIAAGGTPDIHLLLHPQVIAPLAGLAVLALAATVAQRRRLQG